MKTHQKPPEVLWLPTSNYKSGNTNLGVNQYVCKDASVTLTGGHRISMPLPHIQCFLMRVGSPSPAREKKKKNKPQQQATLPIRNL